MSKQRKAWFCQDCRIVMSYDTKQDFYKCPECGTEVWPNTEVATDEISSLMSDLARTHQPRECLPAGEAIPGGRSNRSKSRARKTDRMKKEPLATLNRKLYMEC